MPLYYTGETRVTRQGWLERLTVWLLFGPRQHDHDLLISLGPVSSAKSCERAGKNL